VFLKDFSTINMLELKSAVKQIIQDKGKPFERMGRKATDLRQLHCYDGWVTL